MRTFNAIEIILASTVATLMLASGAAAEQHFSRYEARRAARDEALQSAPAAGRAPAVSWYGRKTGHIAESSAVAATVPFSRFHEHTARNCSASSAKEPQRPWCS